jgi:hypothetical protein
MNCRKVLLAAQPTTGKGPPFSSAFSALGQPLIAGAFLPPKCTRSACSLWQLNRRGFVRKPRMTFSVAPEAGPLMPRSLPNRNRRIPVFGITVNRCRIPALHLSTVRREATAPAPQVASVPMLRLKDGDG